MLRIAKKLYREDKLIVAVKNETSESYINEILRKSVNDQTPKAQQILKDLRKLADENEKWFQRKANKMKVKIEFEVTD